MASVIFEHIKDYSFAHPGVALVDAAVTAMTLEVPGIGDYLDARMIKGDERQFFKTRTQKPIREDKMFETDTMAEFGVIKADVWASETEVKHELFDETGS